MTVLDDPPHLFMYELTSHSHVRLLVCLLVGHQYIKLYRVENSKGDHSESPLGDFRGPFFWQKGDQKETFLLTKGDFFQI